VYKNLFDGRADRQTIMVYILSFAQ